MPQILLAAFGAIENEALENIRTSVSKAFRSEARIIPGEQEMPECRKRGEQINAGDFVPTIEKIVAKENADFGLGIVDRDLYSGNLNFVFGIAYLNSSVISLARLKSEKKELFLERAVKEAIHEIGHLFGLGHCPDTKCVMHFSNCLADTDIKSEEFCEKCGRKANV